MGLSAELVLVNANVITVDPERPRAEALAIRKGNFAAVGTAREMKELTGPRTQVWDLVGKTEVPGFIDAHTHVLMSGLLHVMCEDCNLWHLSEEGIE